LPLVFVDSARAIRALLTARARASRPSPRIITSLLDALIALDDGVAGEPSAQALHAQYRALLAAYPRSE
jgi:hypothetical protein